MHAKPTSRLPENAANTPTTPRTHPCTALTTEIPATGRIDARAAARVARLRKAVWLEIADGLVQEYPTPLVFDVARDGSHATLSTLRTADVQAWADFFGFPVPHVTSFTGTSDPATRFTVTRTHGRVGGVTVLYVEHVRREPVEPASPMPSPSNPGPSNPGPSNPSPSNPSPSNPSPSSPAVDAGSAAEGVTGDE